MTLCACVIIGREIVVSALREWMAQLGRSATLKVSRLGKWKTGFQMVAIIALLLLLPDSVPAIYYWLAQLILLACSGVDFMVNGHLPAGFCGRGKGTGSLIYG